MSGGDRWSAPGGTGFADHRFAVPLAANVVVRPRLHARLGEGLAAPCVLIAAPAGWGKTLLASSWLSTGGAHGAAVWVSLGPAEDDLHAFWATVAEALVPAVGDPAAASLRNAVAGDLELAPGQVAAAVNGTPVVLVLDNLHEITRPVVHESLLRLVHRPPPGLRIVAITRRNPPWPLHRLRLAGVLTEIRAVDLAFREDEARALLDGLGIDLDPVDPDRTLELDDIQNGACIPGPHRTSADTSFSASMSRRRAESWCAGCCRHSATDPADRGKQAWVSAGLTFQGSRRLVYRKTLSTASPRPSTARSRGLGCSRLGRGRDHATTSGSAADVDAGHGFWGLTCGNAGSRLDGPFQAVMFVLVRTLLMRPEFDDLLGWVDAQVGEDVAAEHGTASAPLGKR